MKAGEEEAHGECCVLREEAASQELYRACLAERGHASQMGQSAALSRAVNRQVDFLKQRLSTPTQAFFSSTHTCHMLQPGIPHLSFRHHILQTMGIDSPLWVQRLTLR